MVSDLEERERAAAAGDGAEDQLREEERAARVFREEVARLRAMAAMKQGAAAPAPVVLKVPKPAAPAAGVEKILKVSWGKGGGDYTPATLRELFGEFGEVEDVVFLEKKKSKKRSALVVMASKATAALSAEMVCGDALNPLQANLMISNANASAPNSRTPAEPEPPNLSDLVGAGYQANENLILEKMRKAAERQRKLSKAL